jgi:pimeloyl-ACP methyl ester carboxylesterase
VWGPVSAQADNDTVQAGADRCTAAIIGAAITAQDIGEPVAGVQFDRFTWIPATERSGALCTVEGRILPVDTAPTARPIRFAVGLPAAWNRRSIHQGGGGMNGSVPQFAPNPQRPAFPGMPPSDVSRGFAVYGSDSGHGAQDSEWALNDEAIRNFGYAQLKKTHDVAQILIRRLYGEKPRYRYFIGTSQGGREALTVAQRYPADYEGVAANVPVVALNGLMQAPAAIRRRENLLADHVPQAKAKAIAAEFMRQCDGLDGIDDAVINNYMACRGVFDVNDGKGTKTPWSARRCKDGKDPAPDDTSDRACLTDGQIGTLQFIFSRQSYGASRAYGTKHFGMWAPSTEVAVGGLPPATGNALINDIRYRGQEGAAAEARTFSSLGSVGLTGMLLHDLAANPLTDARIASQEMRQKQLSGWLDSTNPDLRAFERRGGKLIVAIGTNDTLASPGAQLDYYAALSKKMGRRLDRFARLYVLPQRGHGLQGSNYTLTGLGNSVPAKALPSEFNRLELLQKWVEQGMAPARSHTLGGTGGATALMCSYPQHPHYQGGAPEQSASWRCQ